MTLDLNSCTEAELLSLRGIGKAYANSIISGRKHEAFRSAQDLIRRVKWMGAVRWAQICNDNAIGFAFGARSLNDDDSSSDASSDTPPQPIHSTGESN